MGLKIGICGLGSFASHFVPLFKAHPEIDDVYLADLWPDLVAKKAAEFEIATTFASLDELCASDCDCIGLFTQRWMHGSQAVQALKAGKHVFSAVPAAFTIEELHELVETVKSTGLTYMLAETSYYRPQTIYCRQRFAKGDFGRFVYGEGQYHPDGIFDADLRRTNGVEITEENLGRLPRAYLGRRHEGVTPLHPVERLPAEFVGLSNGHRGAHQFLVVDFVEAVKQNKLPPNHVWLAARYNAPGIVAHDSAKREGELLKIPDFGMPPADAGALEWTHGLEI